ncbi:DUF4440 domain-containing protein [Silvanigrella paludirubra]|uniref:nuclear transport factor 2 family protein n=1 Tax=Silvanigrella paludirubra TaxID=2499159 RepID=UPI00192A5250|nr:DUF4440 domain-containing protein [Silvanigrella paludirubra]
MEQIQLLEEKLLQPSIRHSKSELDSLLADEFFEFTSSGTSFNKTEIINALFEEKDVHYALKNFKITFLSDNVVLANYLAIKNNEIYSLRSSIWKLTNDNWNLIFHQGTVCSSEL